MTRDQPDGVPIAVAYAHSAHVRAESEWEPLRDHLERVSALAAEFASAFGAERLGGLAGLWHDVGKYAPQFQRYLRDSAAAGGRRAGPIVDHSSAGALHATRLIGGAPGCALAFVIAGHHAGLADKTSSFDASLMRRLDSPRPEAEDALKAARHSAPGLLDAEKPPLPLRLSQRVTTSPTPPLAFAAFIRMLFSCLIDADRIATEGFDTPDAAAERERPRPTLPELLASLDGHIDHKVATKQTDPSPANAQRAVLLAACREHATHSPGLFSLTAPTGSGKTLSSMSFALRHAVAHGMRRVIYALPFTTVTEQNAGVYREAFGAHSEAVLEHHSAYDAGRFAKTDPHGLPSQGGDDGDTLSAAERRRRQAAENWDAPVIVTTNVQLFESLFSAHPSDCRKLHRIARSVIVLDEAQTLPPNLLKPTLAILDELAASYGCSIVLCSATMPAVNHREGFNIGLRGVREIVPDPEAMAAAMRRVRVDVLREPGDEQCSRAAPLTDDQIVDRLAAEPRGLVIVNTRKHARRLFELAQGRFGHEPGLLHLSALMCPAHRSARVEDIKRRLASGEPCRVISTQVVEAGVDIDFPLVLRAMAGLDSIVQAAGRCNREGRLTDPMGKPVLGRVIVFSTDEKPPGEIGRAADVTTQILDADSDPLGLDIIEHYFRMHYWSRKNEWDRGLNATIGSDGITQLLGTKPGENGPRLLFRQAADRYRLIDDNSARIIVPYGPGGTELCENLQKPHGSVAELLRKAQRYSINIPPWRLETLISGSVCVTTECGVAVLLPKHGQSHYSDDLGLLLDEKPDPAAIVV